MTMYMKIHDSPAGKVVALCDRELIGKRLSEGKAVLDLQLHSGFYVGRLVAQAEAIAALGGAQNANIVGERSMFAAKKAGLPTGGAISIAGVPHLQVYRL